MSAYGAGAPTYESAELQRFTISGRLGVARFIHQQHVDSGDTIRAARWAKTIDELFDKLNEVRGR